MKVSVIVPCYNQAQYLDDALQSVLDQTYQDWECIIINDGSTDHTQAQSQLWTAKDQRFKYVKKENGGLPSARNYGITQANGTYILPLDADDYLSLDYLAQCVSVLKSSKVKLVYGRVEQFGEKHGSCNFGMYSYEALWFTNMIHCSAMYRKADWMRVGGYDEQMNHGLEDWEFWLRIIDVKDEVVMLKSVILNYRIKSNSMIAKMDKTKELEIKAYVFKKHCDQYFSVYAHLGASYFKLRNDLNRVPFVIKKLLKLLVGKTQNP